MKLNECKKVAKVIKRKLDQIAKRYGVKNDTVVGIRDESSNFNDDWVGVEVRTDDDMYDLLYCSYTDPYLAAKLLTEILNATKLDPRKHYFEKDVAGVFVLF